MLKSVFAVCLSMALLIVITEAISSTDHKDDDFESMLMKDSAFTFGGDDSKLAMHEDGLSVKKRVPAACVTRCPCHRLTARTCNYCRYIRSRCLQRYGRVVDA